MGFALSTAACKAKKKVCFDKTGFLSLINNACINLCVCVGGGTYECI